MLTGLAVMLVLTGGAGAVDKPGLALDSAQVYDTAQPADDKSSAEVAPVFSFKQTRLVGLHLAGSLAGNTAAQQKLNVFAALRDSSGLVLTKLKDESWIGSGSFTRDFPELLECGSVLGRQDYTLELEVSVKGYAPVRQTLRFHVDGMPRPDVAHVQLRLLNRDGEAQDGFGPGARYSAECSVDLRGYQSTLAPELILLSELAGGSQPRSASDIARNEAADSIAVLKLRLAPDGRYRVVANGSLPDRFSDPAQDTHAFRLYTVLRIGHSVLDSDTALGMVNDNRSERDRQRGDDYGIALDHSDGWSIREL
jgi:hypothetical protein